MYISLHWDREKRERRGGGSKKEQTNFLIDPRYYLEFIVSAAIGTARVLFVAPWVRDTDAIGEWERKRMRERERERENLAWEWDRIESAMWVTRKLLVVPTAFLCATDSWVLRGRRNSAAQGTVPELGKDSSPPHVFFFICFLCVYITPSAPYRLSLSMYKFIPFHFSRIIFWETC